MKIIGLVLFLVTGISLYGHEQKSGAVLELVRKLGSCGRCGKKLTIEDFLYTYGEEGSLYVTYCKSCLQIISVRPLQLVSGQAESTTTGQWLFDDGFMLLNRYDWDDDDEELSCTVNGWHFRIRKHTKKLYASSPDDSTEIRANLDHAIVDLYPADGSTDKAVLKDARGGTVVLNTKQHMFGLKPGQFGTPMKTHEEMVQEELEKINEPSTKGIADYFEKYYKRIKQIISEETGHEAKESYV